MATWTRCRLCGKETRAEKLAPRRLGAKCWQRLLAFVADELGSAQDAANHLLTCSDEQIGEWVVAFKEEATLHVWHTRSAIDVRLYVPPRVWRTKLRELGKSEAHLTHLMGGDRALRPPAKPYWRPLYAPPGRWLPREALRHLEEIKAAQRKRRPRTRRP